MEQARHHHRHTSLLWLAVHCSADWLPHHVHGFMIHLQKRPSPQANLFTADFKLLRIPIGPTPRHSRERQPWLNGINLGRPVNLPLIYLLASCHSRGFPRSSLSVGFKWERELPLCVALIKVFAVFWTRTLFLEAQFSVEKCVSGWVIWHTVEMDVLCIRQTKNMRTNRTKQQDDTEPLTPCSRSLHTVADPFLSQCWWIFCHVLP